ncbi:MAG: TetR/AcrR family transcriptional regulator [Sodaliphilus sp.]|nr:TetR/AcrR family transcriptional regulator [Sodaliphilus sp.]
MEQKKVDRRIAKTKKAIYRAFAELLSEKNINDITIKDIADKADINRKTFYNYYNGIYDLTGEIENSIIDSFEQVLRNTNINELLHNPYSMFEALTRIINSNLDFYQHLISIESNSNLVSKLFKSLKTRAKEVISQYTLLDDATLDIVLDFVVSGMFTVFQHWFNSSREHSIDDLAKIVATLSFNGINGLLQDFEKTK